MKPNQALTAAHSRSPVAALPRWFPDHTRVVNVQAPWKTAPASATPGEHIREDAMPKGYWIARVDVSDADAYKNYVAANAVAFAKFGARFIVRGGQFESQEGTARDRNVVIEFDSYQQAVDCYHSPEYAAAMEIRKHASTGDLIIIEGYDGPQPGDA
jgi:uncharacterized protein (DUF1330 family)